MVLSLIPSPRFKIIIVTDISIYVSSGKGFHRFSESFSILSYPWIIKKKFYKHYQRFEKSLLYIVFFSFDSLEFIIKFGYNARCHWFAERVFYQSTKHKNQLKRSRHLPICTIADHFPGVTPAFSFC